MSQKITGIIAGVVAGVVAATVASRGVTNLFGGAQMKAKHGVVAATPSGWTKFHSKDGGFTIATPKRFTQLDPKSPEVAAGMSDAVKNNPELKGAIERFTSSPDIRFYAIDLESAKTGFAINVNVTKSSLSSGIPKTDKALSEFRKGAESTIPPGARIVKCEFVELPAGSAILMELELSIRDEAGTTVARSVTYTVPDEKEMYTIAMGSKQESYQKTAPLFRSIANTLSLD